MRKKSSLHVINQQQVLSRSRCCRTLTLMNDCKSSADFANVISLLKYIKNNDKNQTLKDGAILLVNSPVYFRFYGCVQKFEKKKIKPSKQRAIGVYF